jgi:hypothetical protein
MLTKDTNWHRRTQGRLFHGDRTLEAAALGEAVAGAAWGWAALAWAAAAVAEAWGGAAVAEAWGGAAVAEAWGGAAVAEAWGGAAVAAASDGAAGGGAWGGAAVAAASDGEGGAGGAVGGALIDLQPRSGGVGGQAAALGSSSGGGGCKPARAAAIGAPTSDVETPQQVVMTPKSRCRPDYGSRLNGRDASKAATEGSGSLRRYAAFLGTIGHATWTFLTRTRCGDAGER